MDTGLTRVQAEGAAAIRARLRIFATTDLHLSLCPWDHFIDRPQPGCGLASAAGAILSLRAAFPDSLLVDNGDFLQGNPLGDALADMYAAGHSAPHPMVEAMNLLAYDAVALGNHDLNYGLGFLQTSLEAARFLVLCANLRRCDGAPPFAVPWTVLDRRLDCSDGRRRRIRIGLSGLIPPQVTAWDASHLVDRVRVSGIVETARTVVERMRAAGADIVIMLCHSGIGTAAAALDPQAEHAALAVAMLPGVDAVIAGHSHQVFPGSGWPEDELVDPVGGRLAGKPACMPGFAASHLGWLDLELERHRNRRWVCRGGQGHVASLDAAQPNPLPPRFAALCARADQATRRYLDRPAGHSVTPLTSYFAMMGDCVATRLVARAQRWHATRMLADTPYAGLPVLAAAAPMRAGGRGGAAHYTDLPAGALRERDLLALCPFPNTVRALRVTGQDLADWLEHASCAFRLVAPGARDACLLNPEWPAYNFDLIEGLTYEIALDQPPAGRDAKAPRRIRDLCFEGLPVAADDQFILATSSFRADGGGGFPGCGAGADVVLAAPTLVRSVVGAFLAIEGPFRMPQAPVWSFAPSPGTSVVVETGPGALAQLPRRGMEPLGLNDNGFLRIRLHL